MIVGDRVRRKDQRHLTGTVRAVWVTRKKIQRVIVNWDINGGDYPVWAAQLEIIAKAEGRTK